MRVADLVLEILAAHGVRDIFGVPGDAINDITNALRKRDDMQFILVRHEMAAGGDARFSTCAPSSSSRVSTAAVFAAKGQVFC